MCLPSQIGEESSCAAGYHRQAAASDSGARLVGLDTAQTKHDFWLLQKFVLRKMPAGHIVFPDRAKIMGRTVNTSTGYPLIDHPLYWNLGLKIQNFYNIFKSEKFMDTKMK